MNKRQIILKKVRVNNLKNIDLTLPHEQFIVFTGVSGSGKSSIAFDTIFVEGQRRYIESLSHYARRYIESEKKPEADLIFGLSPTIAIEQKSIQRSPRSTIGTMTGIYDFLRVLFAKVATLHCPISGDIVVAQSKETIFQKISSLAQKKIILLAPVGKNKKGSFI
jgi:excinuclease ABC subunit A